MRISASISWLIAGAALLAPAPTLALGSVGRVRRTPQRRLSMVVLPGRAQAGTPALAFGRLTGSGASGRTVTLFHQLAPGQPFTSAAQVTTGAQGFYLFTHVDATSGLSRAYFVRAAGTRSRTTHQRLAAVVSLQAPAQSPHAGQAVTFTGHVGPATGAGQEILLQRQLDAGGSDWMTVASTSIAADGTFSLSATFAAAGSVTLRALLAADAANRGGASDPVDVLVDGAPNGQSTLLASADPIEAGQQVTLSGALGQTSAPASVTLLARAPGQALTPAADTTTDASGNFSFTELPPSNTEYRVRGDGQISAALAVGVRDVVGLTPAAPVAGLGQTLAFGGTMLPGAAGQVVQLQQLGDDGAYRTLAQGVTGAAGADGVAPFSVSLLLTDPGSRSYRVLVPGGPQNQTGISRPVSVAVTPATAAQVAPLLARLAH